VVKMGLKSWRKLLKIDKPSVTNWMAKELFQMRTECCTSTQLHMPNSQFSAEEEESSNPLKLQVSAPGSFSQQHERVKLGSQKGIKSAEGYSVLHNTSHPHTVLQSYLGCCKQFLSLIWGWLLTPRNAL